MADLRSSAEESGSLGAERGLAVLLRLGALYNKLALLCISDVQSVLLF